MIDLSRSRIPPYAHQVTGVEEIISHPYFLLADEMGAGKTRQAIDAAHVLFHQQKINRVIVISPAPVRDVWFHPQYGELAKHLWEDTASQVIEYHAKSREWKHGTPGTWMGTLLWIVTNYDYMRTDAHLNEMLTVANDRTLLILDESSAVARYNTQQTKACLKLRRKCGRVLLMNGTPISDNPGNMYSQGLIMHPSILDCRGVTHFRSRYAVMNSHIVVKTKWGNMTPVVDKWTNLEDLQRRFAPYVIRRLKKDCLDLPEKLPPVTIPVTLTEPTWKIYQQMKTEMVAWLETHPAGMVMASQAMVKAMRLAQITSGFLGGVETFEDDIAAGATPEDAWLNEIMNPDRVVRSDIVREIGTEKLDLLLDWLQLRVDEDPHFKILVWCRFRPEVERLHRELAKHYKYELGKIIGGQTEGERSHALRLLDPRTAPNGATVVVGTPATGSMGLNLTAASNVMYVSNDYSLKIRLQSEDRVHRPGQTRAVSYFDLVAVGPKGQKTIDADIIKALRDKQNIAEWTASAWIRALAN